MSQKIIHWDLESTNLAGDIGILLCGGYKFDGEKPKVISVLDFPKSFSNGRITDKYLVQAFYEILTSKQVGMWSTWYGTGFDIPMFTTRLLEFRMPPLPNMPHCDGWKIARKKLKLHNNRLATVSAFLGIEEKTPLKLSVWRDAGMGHRPSIKYVIEHCLQDTVVLEQAYNVIKPYANAQIHPNLANIRGVDGGCPRCASTRTWRRGVEVTSKVRWIRHQCQDCGAWFRGGQAP